MDGSKSIERDIVINAYYMISLFEASKKEMEEQSSNSLYFESNEEIKEKNSFNKSDNNFLNKIVDNRLVNTTIISNLKLQKLMYFVEAYYMSKTGEKRLYDTEWSAWDYGPVNKKLYNYFKKYGSMEITLGEEEKSKIELLNSENKECIKKVYEVLGKFSAFELVTLTHLPDSPWDKLKNSGKYNFDKLNDSIIKKEETRDWFDKILKKFFESSDINE